MIKIKYLKVIWAYELSFLYLRNLITHTVNNLQQNPNYV